MARGKQACKILKEIRRQIAEANGIEFITSECRYKGDCLGTCPKCEAEVRYLEQQLRARSLAGKAIALAGISAGMILMSGCSGTSSNQSSVTLTEDSTKVVDSSDYEGEIDEECLLSKNRDTIFNSETEVSGIKEGEISNDPNEVVTHVKCPMNGQQIQMKRVFIVVLNKCRNFLAEMQRCCDSSVNI